VTIVGLATSLGLCLSLALVTLILVYKHRRRERPNPRCQENSTFGKAHFTLDPYFEETKKCDDADGNEFIGGSAFRWPLPSVPEDRVGVSMDRPPSSGYAPGDTNVATDSTGLGEVIESIAGASGVTEMDSLKRRKHAHFIRLHQELDRPSDRMSKDNGKEATGETMTDSAKVLVGVSGVIDLRQQLALKRFSTDDRMQLKEISSAGLYLGLELGVNMRDQNPLRRISAGDQDLLKDIGLNVNEEEGLNAEWARRFSAVEAEENLKRKLILKQKVSLRRGSANDKKNLGALAKADLHLGIGLDAKDIDSNPLRRVSLVDRSFEASRHFRKGKPSPGSVDPSFLSPARSPPRGLSGSRTKKHIPMSPQLKISPLRLRDFPQTASDLSSFSVVGPEDNENGPPPPIRPWGNPARCDDVENI